MGDCCEGFQVVRGRKFRNKSKYKNLKLPTVDHCDESTNSPAALSQLLASIQNCRLELCESNFRKDFEATVSKAGILETATEECRGDASRSASQIKQIVSYGIGKYSTCPIARYQFAFLSILCELFKIERKDCFVYDPQFSSLEREGVLSWGFQLIDVNEEGKKRSEERTLFYMLHCGKALYNNLVWANWNPVHLNNTIIIGNSFTGMSERFQTRLMPLEEGATQINDYKLPEMIDLQKDLGWLKRLLSLPEKEFKTDLYCISKAMPVMKEFSIPNTFVHKDIFNSTSLHIFCTDNALHEGKMTADVKLMWPTIEEPKYNDCEIITARLQTTHLLH